MKSIITLTSDLLSCFHYFCFKDKPTGTVGVSFTQPNRWEMTNVSF